MTIAAPPTTTARPRRACVSSRRLPSRKAATMPATEEITLNTTSRPSTNGAPRCDHPDGRGRGEGEAAAQEQRQDDQRECRHGEPPRRRRRVGAVPERALERDHDRCEHDQRVESIAGGREGRGRSRSERTSALQAPPPTQVGDGIVFWSEHEHGLPTTSCRAASVASMAEVHTREGGRKCPQRPPRRTSRREWEAGAPTTGRRRRSAGSRSSSSPSRSAWPVRSRSTRTPPGRANRAGWTGFSTRASSAQPRRAS